MFASPATSGVSMLGPVSHVLKTRFLSAYQDQTPLSDVSCGRDFNGPPNTLCLLLRPADPLIRGFRAETTRALKAD